MNITYETIQNLDGTLSNMTYFDVTEVNLEAMLYELYEQHWNKIVTTYLIQGAVFELFPTKPETITTVDGYLTIDTPSWHIHLCLGDNKHNGAKKEDKEQLRAIRRVTKAAFIHSINHSCIPEVWSLCLWNGAGEQMVNIVFPNPFLENEEKPQFKNPQWDKLLLWRTIQKKYLNIDVPTQTAKMKK